MNISDWIKNNEGNFGSPFEKEFVINILGKINSIDFKTVKSQYHFNDLDGNNRFCDFVIEEGSIKIAIEIDGYDKRNSGQGMSHDDFIDWQRRQAALTALGWHVLRFANRDVMKEPARCRYYIELLLQDQRSKNRHQVDLEREIDRLSHQLKITKIDINEKQESDLHKEINFLKNQLKIAQNTKPLNSGEKSQLDDLIHQLEEENKKVIDSHNRIKKEMDLLEKSNLILKTNGKILDGENDTMKTTIWAFVTIIGVLIAAGVYIFNEKLNPSATKPNKNDVAAFHQGQPNIEHNSTQQPTIINQSTNRSIVDSKKSTENEKTSSSTSCINSIEWSMAANHVDKIVSVRGMVEEYRYMPNKNGSPTWINLGAKYPVKNRLSVVIWGDDREKFQDILANNLVHRQICVIGRVKLWDGTPQIVVKSPNNLLLY